MSDNGDDEETEVFPTPSIPSMHIFPIKFKVPYIPIKPTPTGVQCAECAAGVGQPYRPFMDRGLMLLSTYDISLYEPPARWKDLELSTAYSVSVPTGLAVIKDLQLKTEYEIQMMNWFAEKGLLLSVEPGIYVHHGMILSQDLLLKTENAVTVPEFKTAEKNLLLKTENIAELMSVTERAKNLGLSVEVGIIPTIGVTMDIFAGTKVEVELSSVGETLIEIENMLKSSYEAKMMIIPVTVSNKLKTMYNVILHKYATKMYPGYTLTDFLDKTAEKTLGLKVIGRIAHITEMYPGYTITDFMDKSREGMLKLKVEGKVAHITEMYPGYTEVEIWKNIYIKTTFALS
ncbi:hypothetical protein KAX02_07450 [candidate division WOR-3 bacterium]|nr:hypothetical protein [candidate division WOR-3 bacterium]